MVENGLFPYIITLGERLRNAFGVIQIPHSTPKRKACHNVAGFFALYYSFFSLQYSLFSFYDRLF